MNVIITIRLYAAIVLLFMAESVSAQTGNLSLSSGSATAAGIVTVPLSLTGGAQPAAIQWTLLYSSDITAVTVTDGPAVVNASKTTTCASSPGKTICLVAGLNQNSLGDGVLANVTLQLAPAVSTSSIPVQVTGTVAASIQANAVAVSASGAAISVVAAPQISVLSCSTTSILFGTSATCTLTLDKNAPAGGAVANLLSDNANLSVPSTVTVAGGTTAIAFTVTAKSGTAASESAVISASLGSSARTLPFTLVAPLRLASFVCSATEVVAGTPVSCTVSLSEAAPLQGPGIVVSLASAGAAIAVPSTVTIPAGATAANFNASAGAAVSETTSVILTATYLSTTASTTLNAVAGPRLYIRGGPSEMAGTANGSLLTPTIGPSDLKGAVTLRGKGYIDFAPIQNGDGISFHFGGPQNADTAYINFTGAAIGTIFQNKGEARFVMTSSYSFAERLCLPTRNLRYVYDVVDGSGRRFYFATYTVTGRMQFLFSAGTAQSYAYYVPVGKEDAVFGKDVTAKIRLTWDGTTATLYVNDVQVYTTRYTLTVPAWTGTPNLVFGAQAPVTSMGPGLFALDDKVADLEIR
jgi:hypothetical protein